MGPGRLLRRSQITLNSHVWLEPFNHPLTKDCLEMGGLRKPWKETNRKRGKCRGDTEAGGVCFHQQWCRLFRAARTLLRSCWLSLHCLRTSPLLWSTYNTKPKFLLLFSHLPEKKIEFEPQLHKNALEEQAKQLRSLWRFSAGFGVSPV